MQREDQKWSERRLEGSNVNREKIVAESDAAFQKLTKAHEDINNIFRPFMTFSHIQRKPQSGRWRR